MFYLEKFWNLFKKQPKKQNKDQKSQEELDFVQADTSYSEKGPTTTKR